MTGSALGPATTALSVGFPLLVAAGLWLPGLRRVASACVPWAGLPALGLWLLPRGSAHVEWGWLLFGLRLDAGDEVTRAFLLFTSALWLLAGLSARHALKGDPHRARFESFFLLTLAGNLGVVLAAEVVGFYCFYALMTFAAYGLVVHERTEEALRAGRVYLVMALIGELLLLAAFLLIVGKGLDVDLREVPARVALSARRELLVGLLLVGFGIKAGALGLHLWLPLAHPVAPTPASAVLSGAMIKAGLLGWLRFLPLGTAALPEAGLGCLVVGFTAAFLGVALGLTQRNPKTMLAYSSVSQMGFMTAALGVGLSSPAAAPAAVTAICLYAFHHALAKGALFLGTGVAKQTGGGWPRRLVTLGLVWPALAIAAAPLSTGALAKLSLKTVLEQSPWAAAGLPALLSLAAVGSTLLLSAFVLRAMPQRAERPLPPAGLWAPWAVLLLLELGLVLRAPVAAPAPGLLVLPGKLWSAAWPVCVGLLIAAAARRFWHRLPRVRPVPAGDVLWLLEALSGWLRGATARAREALPRALAFETTARRLGLQRAPGRLLELAERAETGVSTSRAIGLLFVLLMLAAVVLGASL